MNPPFVQLKQQTVRHGQAYWPNVRCWWGAVIPLLSLAMTSAETVVHNLPPFASAIVWAPVDALVDNFDDLAGSGDRLSRPLDCLLGSRNQFLRSFSSQRVHPTGA